jgi:hypothetical protein
MICLAATTPAPGPNLLLPVTSLANLEHDEPRLAYLMRGILNPLSVQWRYEVPTLAVLDRAPSLRLVLSLIPATSRHCFHGIAC